MRQNDKQISRFELHLSAPLRGNEPTQSKTSLRARIESVNVIMFPKNANLRSPTFVLAGFLGRGGGGILSSIFFFASRANLQHQCSKQRIY